MQTSTSLTFVTAMFVALGGALAEELMICSRHVRTELYERNYERGLQGNLEVKFTVCWTIIIFARFKFVVVGSIIFHF